MRDRPQRGELLDRLVGGAVLADADRVVGEDEHDLGVGERGEPQRRAHVVEEHEERATGGQHAAVACHADHRRAHGVLADAVVHLPAAGCSNDLGGLPGELGAGVAGEVGGAGDEAGHAVERGVERLLDRDAGRRSSRPARRSAVRRVQPAMPVAAQQASHSASSIVTQPCACDHDRDALAPRSAACCGTRRPDRRVPRTARRGCPSRLWCG